ncbi:hypothetical protein DIPPA_28720 [Diplonema papillatum]|nr:hypothetical protein DIPPA_28720 [Diplonema papillatum]
MESNFVNIGLGGPNSARRAVITFPETLELTVTCYEWIGLEEAGNCTAGLKTWLCAGNDCEPVGPYELDGDDIRVLSPDGETKVWQMMFDSTGMQASCFPRYVRARALFETPELDSDTGYIFPIMVTLIAVVCLAVIGLNGARFLRALRPRILNAYENEQVENERKKKERAEKKAAVATFSIPHAQYQQPGSASSPANYSVPGPVQSPPTTGRYLEMV